MSVMSFIVGFIFGGITISSAVYLFVKSKREKLIRQIKSQQTIELSESKEKTFHLENTLNLQNSENQNNVDRSISTISSVLEESANNADLTSENLENVQAQISDLTNMVESIIGLSNTTSDISQVGVKKVESVVSDITDLTNSKKDLENILVQFKEVQEKTVAIRFIGEEAEMLALNAAIEAARAGDAGRGFAVVATSMKTLAKNSQNTTVDILNIVKQSEQVIKSVTENFTLRGEKLNTSIDSLVDNFKQITASIATIQSQSKGITHDSNGISNMMEIASGATKTSVESLINRLSSLVSILTGKSIVDLSPKKAREQWDSFDEIIDVRRAEEWEQELGKIDGVRLSTLQTSFKQDVKKLDPKKRYLFICRSGGRSTKAAQTAIANGIENVYNLDGGMIEWRRQLHS